MSEAPHRNYGGQALIEGVMIRGARHVSIACRRPTADADGVPRVDPDGPLFRDAEPISTMASRLTQRYSAARWPLVRGTLVLLESMELGSKGLRLSASIAMDPGAAVPESGSETEHSLIQAPETSPNGAVRDSAALDTGPEDTNGVPPTVAGIPLIQHPVIVGILAGLLTGILALIVRHARPEPALFKISIGVGLAAAAVALLLRLVRKEEARSAASRSLAGIAVGATMLLGLVFGISLFFLLPSLVAGRFAAILHAAWALNLVEGAIRVALFFGYLKLIARMPNIRRLFQYHGAEHQVIHVHEHNLELTPENAGQFSTIHPRCGTAFLAIVLVISVLVFAFAGWQVWWQRLLLRVAGLPLIAGISYELLKWNSRRPNRVLGALMAPGLWFQRITTQPPTRDQVEVAIAAMTGVLEAEQTPDTG